MMIFRTQYSGTQARPLPQALGRSPDFVIGSVDDPYLCRWWVIPRNRFFNIYLHHVRRDDDDRALHDHPWWNMSILIKGRLWEHFPDGSCRRLRGFRPYPRRATALHRLEVGSNRDNPKDIPFPKNVWTLFITGPKVRDWGFQCPEDSPAGGWRPWQNFVAENPGEVGRGCGE